MEMGRQDTSWFHGHRKNYIRIGVMRMWGTGEKKPQRTRRWKTKESSLKMTSSLPCILFLIFSLSLSTVANTQVSNVCSVDKQ